LDEGEGRGKGQGRRKGGREEGKGPTGRKQGGSRKLETGVPGNMTFELNAFNKKLPSCFVKL
jgi:hypothetical protein